jgi:multisubunit Na+/H+ antiporter MnhC subunit
MTKIKNHPIMLRLSLHAAGIVVYIAALWLIGIDLLASPLSLRRLLGLTILFFGCDALVLEIGHRLKKISASPNSTTAD